MLIVMWKNLCNMRDKSEQALRFERGKGLVAIAVGPFVFEKWSNNKQFVLNSERGDGYHGFCNGA